MKKSMHTDSGVCETKNIQITLWNYMRVLVREIYIQIYSRREILNKVELQKCALKRLDLHA